ncbi:MAG TPA: dATP/dGTP pyrophosphohydrolase domain-containing protein [Gemmatimonadaceae bacterium]|jgi:NTP pyrophosphatase (non-canonical NTP hydrolase)
MSGMAKGDTYDLYFKDKVRELAKAEAKLLTDESNLYALTEVVNTSKDLLIAVMDVVERLAEKEDAPPATEEGSSLYAIQQKIGEWSRRTFPQSTIDSTIRHLWTEMVELDRAFTSGKDENCREEVADLFILLVQLCNRAGIDLQQAVRQKHEENLNRQWDAPDKHGVVYHTKGK